MVLFFILSFFLIIFALLYAFAQNFKKSNASEALEAYQAYIPIYEAVFEDFRKLNHDFVNHMATLEHIGEDAQTYQQEIENQFDFNALSPLEDPIWMMFVSTWKKRFKEKEITLLIEGVEERGTWFVTLNQIFETVYKDAAISTHKTIKVTKEKDGGLCLTLFPEALKVLEGYSKVTQIRIVIGH